jgi:hypothetical protein
MGFGVGVMRKGKQYVTQLTREDLDELSELTHIEPGFCISIERTGDKVVIGLDKTALAQAINGFVRNGGTNTDALGSTDISFDPPS